MPVELVTSPDLTEQLMKTLWPSFKRRLLAEHPDEEFWIRPFYLFRSMRASTRQVQLLAALPRNGRIISAAVARLPRMREILAPFFSISLTKYPDHWEIEEIKKRFGLDFAPRPWARKRSV